jgi:beta-xylosidase
MKKMILLFLLVSFRISAQDMEQTYRNPVIPGDVPDPSVIRVGDDYYASATTSDFAPCYPLFHSRDLINWERTGAVFDNPPTWIKGDCWAPELFFNDGTYYVYYTARRRADNVSCIGVATTRDMKNGFTDHGVLIEWGSEAIDAFVFKDDDGRLYISWKAYGLDPSRPIELLAAPLSDDGLSLDGDAFSLTPHDRGWTGKGDEGHCIVKRGGDYYLFYSVGGCCDNRCDYRVEVARTKNLRDGFVQYDRNPILQGGTLWKCSGHGTLVQTPDSRYFYLYHAYHQYDFEYTGRQGLLDELLWDEATGWPRFRYGNTPSLQAEVPFKNTTQTRQVAFFDNFTGENEKFWSRDMNRTGADVRFKGLSPQTGHYRMETRIENTTPHFAGLCIYGNSANTLAWGTEGGQIKLYRQEKGNRTELFAVDPETPAVYLRIESAGGRMFRFYYSPDAAEWTVYPPSGESVDGYFLPQWGKGLRCGLMLNGETDERDIFSYLNIHYTY